MGTPIFVADNFVITDEGDYIYDKITGSVSMKSAEESTRRIIEFAQQNERNKLLIDVQDMGWISDMSLRTRSAYLFGIARHVFEQTAIVSEKMAVRQLVIALTHSGGMQNVKGFSKPVEAINWLTSPPT